MTETRSLLRALISSLLIALLALPNTVYAQDFEFGEDDVAEQPETTEDDSTDDGGGMEFDAEDLSKEDAVEQQLPQVAIVAIPGADPEQTRELQQAMSAFAAQVPDIIAVGPETVLPGIMERDAETCVADPICLGSVGDSGNVDRIIVGRVKEGTSGTQLDVDYFNVKDRLFLKYSSQKDLGGTSSIVDAVEPAMKEVLSIRDKGEDQNFTGNESSGVVQDVVAWGAGGLAVVALGLGIFFGLDASSQETEVTDLKGANGIYSITQVEADTKLSEASDTATTANVFYGLAVGLTVVSVVFFIIRGGSDVAADQGEASLLKDLQIAPIITDDTAGLGAGFRF